MKSENKICQKCKESFYITHDDFLFYQKIDVPSPTFCPKCRYIRRLIDRNEYNLYKRKCNATNKDIISIYDEDVIFPVYEQEYWKSDNWDSLSYGRDFDFSRSFFEQYEDLRNVVPHLALVNSNSPNSPYTNQANNNKDCYMLVTSDLCEKCSYGNWCQKSFLCSDCCMAEKSEFCYECINITKCSLCAWTYDCADCVSVFFSNDCRGCTDCFGCVGLRNKQYHWFNENIGKDEYKKRISEFSWDNQSINKVKEKFKEFRLKKPVKFYHGFQTQNSSGDYMQHTQNARYIFNSRDHKNTAYMQDAWLQTTDCMDCTEIVKGELSYEIQGVEIPHKTIVARSCFNTITNSFYCDMCFAVDNCFGCFGLKNKSYCILNKQYSKKDYLELRDRIIEHMKDKNEWGQYFPEKFSPFAYNESMAQDYFPIIKKEALAQGYNWKDKKERNYNITIKTENIPKTINKVSEDILNEIIECKTQTIENEKLERPECTEAFKVTSLDLTLYKKLGLPIPEYCFTCRRIERFKLRNPRTLWERQCMCIKENHDHKGQCREKFKTSYSKERLEIVYCEACYQKEVL